MSKKVAIYQGNDTGGSGACNTPPKPLSSSSQGSRTVFANNRPVIVGGDVLTPASGTTPIGIPCTSPRTVVSSGTVFVNNKPLAKVNDVLNAGTNIRIATGASTVFVV